MLRRIARANEFAGFVVASGIAAAANFLSRIILNLFFSFAVSIVIAYVIGMCVAFALNRIAVFPASGKPVATEAKWFVLVNVLAVLQTLVISLLIAEYILPSVGMDAFRKEIAHGIGIIVPAITSYFGHRHWTFGRRTVG